MQSKERSAEAKSAGWEMPQEQWECSPGSVHCWLGAVDALVDPPRRRAEILSRDEQDRAAGFSNDAAHASFVAGRILLRTVLSGYLRCEPSAIALSIEPNGKPLLDGDKQTEIHFNLSRSAGWVLCAVGRRIHVGVDVERIRILPERDRLMNRFFSPRERLALRERPEEELNAGFFRCWSRKEAYVKARGMGLRLALDGFSVPLWRAGPGERVGPVRHPGSAETWDVIGMPEVQEHAVALCVEHIAETFRFFRMNEEAYV